jgi:hypothetical protein
MEPIVIYPIIASKYHGCIYPVKNKCSTSYRVEIDSNNINYRRNFSTKEDAFEALKAKNIELNLPIRNVIRDYGDYMEVNLTKGGTMKFLPEDIDLVQSHCWILNAYGYASAKIDNKMILFHRILIDENEFNGKSVDHINRCKTDNRATNLRVVDNRTQIINQERRKNNNSGCRGVSYHKVKKAWMVKWRDVNGKQCSITYSEAKYGDQAKQLAIDHRKYIEATLPHYVAALN